MLRCCLFCIYMPAIDESLSLIAGTTELVRDQERAGRFMNSLAEADRGLPLSSVYPLQEHSLAAARQSLEESLRGLGRAQIAHEHEEQKKDGLTRFGSVRHPVWKGEEVIGWNAQELAENLEAMDRDELQKLAERMHGSDHLGASAHIYLASKVPGTQLEQFGTRGNLVTVGMILASVHDVPVQGMSVDEVYALIGMFHYATSQRSFELTFVPRPSDFAVQREGETTVSKTGAGIRLASWKPVWKTTTVTVDSSRELGLIFAANPVADALKASQLQLPAAEVDELYDLRERAKTAAAAAHTAAARSWLSTGRFSTGQIARIEAKFVAYAAEDEDLERSSSAKAPERERVEFTVKYLKRTGVDDLRDAFPDDPGAISRENLHFLLKYLHLLLKNLHFLIKNLHFYIKSQYWRRRY